MQKNNAVFCRLTPKPSDLRYWFVCTALLSALLFPAQTGAAQTEGTSRAENLVRVVRQRYEQITGAAAQSESTDEGKRLGASLFCDTYTENKNGKSVAAVGTYRADYAFYYRYRTEEADKADLLLLATVRMQRAARTQTLEYLFGENGKLAFCFVHDELDNQTRYYFDTNANPVRIVAGTKTRDTLMADDKKAARERLGDAQRLRAFWSSKRTLFSSL